MITSLLANAVHSPDADVLEFPQADAAPTREQVIQVRKKTRAIKGKLVEAMALLLEVHDGKEYRAIGYGTFAEYCRKEFGISDDSGYRYIKAAIVNRNLFTENLRQKNGSDVIETAEKTNTNIRPELRLFRALNVASALVIADLSPEQQRDVYAHAKTIANAKAVPMGRAAKYHKQGHVTEQIMWTARRELLPAPEAPVPPEADMEVQDETAPSGSIGRVLRVSRDPDDPTRILLCYRTPHGSRCSVLHVSELESLGYEIKIPANPSDTIKDFREIDDSPYSDCEDDEEGETEDDGEKWLSEPIVEAEHESLPVQVQSVPLVPVDTFPLNAEFEMRSGDVFYQTTSPDTRREFLSYEGMDTFRYRWLDSGTKGRAFLSTVLNTPHLVERGPLPIATA